MVIRKISIIINGINVILLLSIVSIVINRGIKGSFRISNVVGLVKNFLIFLYSLNFESWVVSDVFFVIMVGNDSICFNVFVVSK